MVYVVDANVWMDMHEGGIPFHFLHLPYHFLSVDIVLYELDDQGGRPPSDQVYQHGGVNVKEIAPKDQSRLRELIARYPENALGDCASLVLAEVEKAILLTGDKNLRIASSNEGVSVRGTLWLLDEMVDKQILSPQHATASLQAMLAGDRRLPKGECTTRLKIWGGQIAGK